MSDVLALFFNVSIQNKCRFGKDCFAIELSKSSILDPRLNGAFEYHCYQYKTPSPDNKLMDERR